MAPATIKTIQPDGFWFLITLSCGHSFTGMGGDLRIGAARNCYDCDQAGPSPATTGD
jgi:hypothetical protein